MTSTAKRDVFAEISSLIAAQLEQGVRPWAKPWKDGMSPNVDTPHNAISGKAYRGANVWYLMALQNAHGYETAAWLTFNQAKDRGGSVRKGEKGTLIFFWHFGTKIDKETGVESKSVTVRTYSVFNIAQTEGVKMPDRKAQVELTPAERNAKAEAMIVSTGAKVRHGGDRAYYSPSQDFIGLPIAEAFKSPDDYYGTAFHELGHWTGHESRLNRQFGTRFGDDAYAFEELVAELTAAFVCGANGFASVAREDHSAYIGSWLRRIKDDPKAFIKASSEAQKAADLIMANAAEDSEGKEIAEAA